MGRGFSNIVYIILIIFVIVGLINLIGFLFPYILIIIGIVWLYRFIKGKKSDRRERNSMNDYRYSNDQADSIQYNEDGDVVDVEYEEINK